MLKPISLDGLKNMTAHAKKSLDGLQAEMREKTTLPFQPHLCVYLDILGTRELFASANVDPYLVEQFLGAIKEFKYYLENRIGLKGKSIIRTFGDSLFAAVPIELEPTKSSAWKVLYFFQAIISYQQWVFSVCKLPLRGGIAIDQLLVDEHAVLGPAFLKAVLLEETAEYPRILIDESVMPFIDRSLLISILPAILPFAQEEEKHPLIYVYQEEENKKAALDYLAAPLMPPLLKSHQEFIDGNLAKNLGAKVRRKYEWLQKYHNDTRDYFDKVGLLKNFAIPEN